MTLKEAIKIVEAWLPFPPPRNDPKAREAIKLGLEALEFVVSWNEKQLPRHQIHLTGETED